MRISKGVRWFAHGSLMVLAIYLGSTYLIKSVTSVPSNPQQAPAKQGNHPAANDARFRSMFDAGNKALHDGVYGTALDNFLEAERSVDQLTDEQYELLKKSRLQIARSYDTSGESAGAQSVYRALANCAAREGQALLDAKQFEGALARAQDAEEFSNHLTEGKRESLQWSISLLVNSLRTLQRYPEAAQAQQRLIDYLKTSTDDYDKGFGEAYVTLSSIYAEEKDWHGVEQALLLAIESCDRTLAAATQQFTGTPVLRNWAQYNLVIADYQEGNIDTAFSKAEEFFAEYSQPQDPTHPRNGAYHADDFAALALQMAKETKRQDAIDLWQKRAPGGLKVITLHPVGH